MFMVHIQYHQRKIYWENEPQWMWKGPEIHHLWRYRNGGSNFGLNAWKFVRISVPKTPLHDKNQLPCKTPLSWQNSLPSSQVQKSGLHIRTWQKLRAPRVAITSPWRYCTCLRKPNQRQFVPFFFFSEHKKKALYDVEFVVHDCRRS